MGTEGVGGEGGAILYVVGFAALTLEDEIGLTDSVSLWVHFLAVQMDGDLLALLAGKLRKRLLGNCQHPACAARAVIDQICARPDLFGNRQEDEACHELHHVPWGEVLTGLLVILLVKAAYELFEDRTHAVVVQAVQTHGAASVKNRPGAKVDRAVQEPLQQEAQGVRFHQRGNLVAELELVQHLLNVGREAVEVCLEVCSQLLLPPAGRKVAEPEGRRVVEGLARGLAQRLILVGYACGVQLGLHAENRVLGRFQNCVESANDRHRQDDVPVLPPDIDITQHIVRDAPDEAADVECGHWFRLI